MYSLEIKEHLDAIFSKLAKKDHVQFQAINRKVQEILSDPYRYKPLKKPLQNKRRVQIFGRRFILIYSIDEKRNIVILEHYGHHDEVYKV